MSKKTAMVVGLVVVGVIALLVVRRIQNSQADPTAGYETVAARKDTLLATVNTSGSVVPKQLVTLSFSSSGIVAEVNVSAGQHVDAGRPLVRLDSRQLQSNVDQAEATLRINQARLAQTKAGSSTADIAAAEASVASAEAVYNSAKNKLGLRDDQLSIAESDLKRAELALKDAQGAYDRVATRPDIGMLPQSGALERATLDYQRALSNYRLQVAAVDDTAFKSAAAQLAQAKAQLEKLSRAPTPEDLTVAEAQVQQAQASLEQASLRLNDATLTAPFSGTVLACKLQASELAGAGSSAIMFADLSSYHVDTTIDETDIGRVKEGQDATVGLDAFADLKLPGRVTSVAPLGNSVQGVVSYAVEIEILPTDAPIRPGLTAIADIVVERKEGVLVVPNGSIKRDSRGRYYVELLSGGQVEQRVITPGLSNDTVTEVVDGLAEGEQVVVSSPRRNSLTSIATGGQSSFGFGTGE